MFCLQSYRFVRRVFTNSSWWSILTINTHLLLFNFNRLAPGIKSAPGHSQQIVDIMLAGIDNVSVYFDDICVAGHSYQHLQQTLENLFKRLQEFGFHIKLEKWKFFVNEICNLGNIIDKRGIRPDIKKIEPIINMPPPQSLSELRSFLGAINFYGKFINNMRNIRAPLDEWLKSTNSWSWFNECQQSFQKFKDILSSNLMLTHYDPNLPVASNVGIGACIYNRYPDNSIKVIYHASRSLSPAEQNYRQIEDWH